MATRDELLAELFRLIDELEKQRRALGDPPPAERPRHPAFYSQPGFPYFDDGTGEWMHTENFDPYSEMKADYAKRLQAISETEANISAIRAQLIAGPSLPADPITIKQMCDLCGLAEGTIRNWRIQGRPAPIQKKRGNRPAIFSYEQLRGWFVGKRPDLSRWWPESYDDAINNLGKPSVQSG